MSKPVENFKQKEIEVSEAKSQVPLAELRAQIRDLPAPLGFKKRLAASSHRPSLIAEVKKASPSQGLIRAEFDPVEVATAYLEAGADCLSVLTDVKYFQGAPEYLPSVKARVGLPCLRKDFLFDPYQVVEALAWGADAILVIIAGVSKESALVLMETAFELGMDALVEVHTPEVAQVALELGADFIGVNNRNLADFTTDLAMSEAIIPMLGKDVIAVSESALSEHGDVQRAAAAGARSVLIGTAFCGSEDVAGRVREVMGW